MTNKQREEIENKIKSLAESFGKCDIYYVGGYVRDEILDPGKWPEDADLVVDMKDGGIEFANFLEKNYPEECKDFVVYPRFGTAKFSLTVAISPPAVNISARNYTIEVECVCPRSEKYNDGPRKPSEVSYASLQEDAKRRDFCCNALYKNAVTGEVLDPTGKGLGDINAKLLRTPCDPKITFKDDPLRMLRAIRFAATKGFTIEEGTYQAISDIPEYYQLSMERVRDEFSKILASTDPKKYIWILHDTHLLKNILPEFEEAWGFNQNSKYHSMNLTDHSLEVLSKAKTVQVIPKPPVLIKMGLASLLHDISKYRIHETLPDGHFSYHGHEKDSATMARTILTRLKYSNEMIDEVCKLIENHMRIKQMYSYDKDTFTGSRKFVRRLMSEFEPCELDELLSLINADNNSHAPEWNMPGQVTALRIMINEEIIQVPTQNTVNRIVSGDDVIQRFGLKQGKQVGEVLKYIDDMRLEHPDYNKETLLRMYEAEFGEGKKIYITRKSTLGSNGGEFIAHLIPLSTSRQEKEILWLDESENIELSKKLDPTVEEIEVLAIDHPDLYTRIRIKKRSRELLYKVFNDLHELLEMPGFDKVRMVFDSYNDGSATISWKDHRDDTFW